MKKINFFLLLVLSLGLLSVASYAQPGGPPGPPDPDGGGNPTGCAIDHTVIGGGSYCAGSNGPDIMLSSSDTGITYQLKNGTTNVGAPISGTGSMLTWTNITAVGTYTVDATNPSTPCTKTMSGSASVAVVALPTVFNVGGTGTYCPSGPGGTVTLNGSQSGVNYQLMNGSSWVGSQIAGTGSALSWPGIVVQGTYTVKAVNPIAGCVQDMNGSAVLTPTVNSYAVGGGGTICSGATGPTITLSGSQSGISYQLKNGSTNVGSAKSGTGAALTWTNISGAATYTIVAAKASPACSVTMTGTATVTVNPLPTLYAVSGTGAYCSGGTGLNITLSNSQTGVNYQLKRGSAAVGSPLPGTGAVLTWTNNTTAGTYTVAATNATTSCVATMTGNAVITVNALPTAFSVSGPVNYCAGGTGVTITLSGSQVGVNYQLATGGVNSGSPIAGTGAALSWTNQTTAGAYTVTATNATTSCVKTMTGTINLSIVPMPAIFNVAGGGTICLGTTGPLITLSGSATGVSYQLKNGAANVGSAKAGTGAALSWTNNSTAGTYTIEAKASANATCLQVMNGNAVVNVNPKPTLFTVSPATVVNCSASTLVISLSGTEVNINYQLKRGSTNIQNAVPGSGNAISWGVNPPVAGTYTVVATNPTTGCTATMTGSSVVTLTPSPTKYTVTGGGSYCQGGSGVTIGLAGSQIGVSYQLVDNNNNNSGTPVAGTGSPLSWPNQTVAGYYHVVATNSTTGCVQVTTSSPLVSINPLPAVINIMGENRVCGGGSLTLGLYSSEVGVNYQLKINGVNTLSPKAGTGSSISWPTQTAYGAYSIIGTRASTGCSQTMAGFPGIYQNPAGFTVSGGGIVCPNPVSISLSGSEVGVQYLLRPPGGGDDIYIDGTGGPLTWAGLTIAGDYEVRAFNPTTLCQISLGMARIDYNLTCMAINNWAFQYKYDDKRRMTHKKVPGADWVYMVYDERDRLVMTQDGNQRIANQWNFTKYDALNRPVITGIYTHGAAIDQAGMSALISNTAFNENFDVSFTSNHGYSNNVFPTTNLNVLTVTYYDDYSFTSLFSPGTFDYVPSDMSGQADRAINAMGQVTGMKLNIIGQATYLRSANYYDDKYRVIQATTDNAVSGFDRLTQVYDFSGKVTDTKATHTKGAASTTIARNFKYDHAHRLLDTRHSLNGAPWVILSRNKYNKLGQLVDKRLHSTNNNYFYQSIDYRYNIRGWIKSINNSTLTADASNDDVNDFFGMNLAYQDNYATSNTPTFNGNISGIKWNASLGQGSIKERAYNYTYDTLNRIKSASFLAHGLSWSGSSQAFNEDGYRYDLNGNIQALNRRNATGALMDKLTYSYGTDTTRSNRLLKVEDGGIPYRGFVDGDNHSLTEEYKYDANGNMIADKNKGINSITYNHLNLPEQVTMNIGYIKYRYNAAGVKLYEEAYDNNNLKKRDYSGEYFYQNDTLMFIHHEEGRIIPGNSNLLQNSDASSTSGFTQYGGDVAVTSQNINGETYVKATCTASGGASTPGIFPIGGSVSVVPGKQYTFKIKGYRTGSAKAYLYVQDGYGYDVVWPGAMVPLDASNEAWVSNTFTAWYGMTTVKLGVLFSQPLAGDAFYINSISLVEASTNDTYQYNLKDHLGNVRVTFTTARDVDTSLATYEPDNISNEDAKFFYSKNIRKINSTIFDHTYDNDPAAPLDVYAERLSGNDQEKVGYTKSLSVMPGDTIRLEVFAKYFDPTATDNLPGFAATMGNIINNMAPAGTFIDGIWYAGNNFTPQFVGFFDKGANTDVPMAYLNWLVYDRDFNLDTLRSGFKRVTAAARENGSNGPHEWLKPDQDIIIRDAGYVEIWLSNENPTPVEVYFDDFKVEQIKSPIIQTDDYYPFGLTFNEYQRENAVPNQWKFQGQEHVSDLGLNWDSFKWRNHQPEIGRFFNIDPMASAFYYNSPYAFSENKVVSHREMEGLEAFFIHGTRADNSMWRKDVTDFIMKELQPYVNSRQDVDTKFKWDDATGGPFKRNWLGNTGRSNRATAARMLAAYIMKNKKEGQDITLIGHSHGGNVAIQAARILFLEHHVTVNIINFNTPAYNSPTDLENPWDNFGIDEMLHFFTDGDNVADGAGWGEAENKYSGVGSNVKQIGLSNSLHWDWFGFGQHKFDNINRDEVVSQFGAMMDFYNSLGGSGTQRKKGKLDPDEEARKRSGGFR